MPDRIACIKCEHATRRAREQKRQSDRAPGTLPRHSPKTGDSHQQHRGEDKKAAILVEEQLVAVPERQTLLVVVDITAKRVAEKQAVPNYPWCGDQRGERRVRVSLPCDRARERAKGTRAPTRAPWGGPETSSRTSSPTNSSTESPETAEKSHVRPRRVRALRAALQR